MRPRIPDEELGFRLFKVREAKRFSMKSTEQEMRKVWKTFNKRSRESGVGFGGPLPFRRPACPCAYLSPAGRTAARHPARLRGRGGGPPGASIDQPFSWNSHGSCITVGTSYKKPACRLVPHGN